MEDERSIALDLKRTLKGFDYTVAAIAKTADEAVRMAVQHNPDLILMDIWLEGGRDGIQAVEELRRQSDVPIVTAHGDADTRRRATAADSSGFLVKPFSAAGLRSEIETAHATHARKTLTGVKPTQRISGAIPTGVPLQVSAVAHDFNNLLMLIMANADALRESGDGREIEQIRRAAQLATMLCRQLLPPARGAASETTAVSEMNAAIESNRRLIERAMGPICNASLRYCAEPLYIPIDESQLSRICLNLALNAQRAMPSGGELRISTRKVGHALAELSVIDSGVGMDSAMLERIFDPFFSGNHALGKGLGLAIVRGIVDQSGGTISVESEPGGGTCFRILFPLVERGATMAPPPAETMPERDRVPGRVLLVEDHDELRAVMRDHLRFAGVNPMCADSGEAAAALLATGNAPVDLIVTDVSLPGMSGTELASDCMRRGLCGHVLFMSGYPAAPRVADPGLAGCTDFITKPFTATEISTKVISILRSIAK